MTGLVVVYCRNCFFCGIQVVLDRERRERRLVEAGQDQLLLARIGVDVAHREDAGDAGLEFLGVDLERLLLQLHAPFGDGAELGMQAEEHEHVVGLEACIVPSRAFAR